MRSNPSLSAIDIAQALRKGLPSELTTESNALAAALAELLSKSSSTTSIQQTQNMAQMLQTLAGHNLTTPQAVLSFGESNSLGDVTIGDIAGGNITKIHINIQSGSTTLNQLEHHSDSETKHKLKLLAIHTRRVHILEQQAAMFGGLCPAHITLEIEDIRAKMNDILRSV